MRHSFKAKVYWDDVPTVGECDYTLQAAACLSVVFEFKIRGRNCTHAQEYYLSSDICDGLESGYFEAEDIWNEINELENI